MYNTGLKYKVNYNLNSNHTVSIILGVKSKESIIIASDSQGSDLDLFTKKLKEVKIFTEQKDESLFIYAGANERYLNQLIFAETIKSYNSDLDYSLLSEKAFNIVKERYPQKVDDKNRLPIHLLTGLRNKKTSEFELYITMPDGIVAPTSSMISIGKREEWAKLIYYDILTREPNIEDEKSLLDIMLFTIKKIKDHDLVCGGDTQYLILNKDCDKIDNIKGTDKEYVKDFEEKNILR